MNDGIRLTDIGKELVSQTFTFAGTLYQTGDIYDLHRRGNHTAFGFTDLTQFNQPLVRHRDHTYVRFNGAEREIRTLCFGVT